MPGAAAGPAAEQVERAVEPAVQVGEREAGEPAGGELDRQRQPVEAADDVGDQPQLGRRRRGTGADPAGPVEEDRDRRGPGRVLPRRAREAGAAPAGRCTPRAAPSGSRLVASTDSRGHADRSAVTVSRDRVEQVLAVVDHQQPGALAEERDAGREDVALDDVQVQRRRQGVRDARPGR